MSDSADRMRKLREKKKADEETAAARAAYIAEAVRGAELVAAQLAQSALSKPPSSATKDVDTYLVPAELIDQGRIERARKYAEWRWDAVAADQVVSL